MDHFSPTRFSFKLTLNEVMERFRLFWFDWILGKKMTITSLTMDDRALKIAHRIIRVRISRPSSIRLEMAFDLFSFGMRAGCREVFVAAIQVLRRSVSDTLANDLFELCASGVVKEPLQLIERAEKLPEFRSWASGSCVPHIGCRGTIKFIPKDLLKRIMILWVTWPMCLRKLS